MRRNGLLIGGWVVATVLALVLGLQGVQAVSNSVTAHRPASLSPASVKAALNRADSESSAASSSESASESEGATGASASSSDAGQDNRSASSSESVAPSPTISPAPDDSGSLGSEGSTSSSPPSSSSSSDDGRSGADGGDDSHSSSTPPAQDKTYQLTGGSVGVRFENGAAHLLWATPNSGYTVENRSTATTVEIRFRSGDHESRLKAYWDNGPREEIEDGGD